MFFLNLIKKCLHVPCVHGIINTGKEEAKMHEFKEYIKWCKEKGYKPSDSDALLEYVAEHPQA